MKTCDKCGCDLKNDLFGSLCEDCWALLPGLFNQVLPNSEIKQGCKGHKNRDAMIAEVRKEVAR